MDIRQAYADEYGRRWQRVQSTVNRTVVDNDGFGDDGRFNGITPEHKARQFRDWLALLMLTMLPVNDPWQDPYLRGGYVRGITNAHLSLRESSVPVEGEPEDVVGMMSHAAALSLLQQQAGEDLRSIQTVAAQQSADRLQVALASGRPSSELAAIANDRVSKIGRTRSRTLVDSLVVGAAAEATLNRFVDAGVSLVSAFVELEFTTAGDERVCPICRGLENQDNGMGRGVFTIRQARGVIPVHPRCRCAWRPLVLGGRAPFTI
jgi:hypothetical protein